MKIRLSYTILKLWEQGKVNDIASIVLGKEVEMSKEMERGKNFDLMVQEFIFREKRLPDELGGLELKKPQAQMKIVYGYNELADLVGVFDIYDEPVIYEIKCSKNSSAKWINDYQLDFYFLLAKYIGLNVKKGILYRYDYLNNDYDKSIVYNNEAAVERMKNRIDSLLPEIYNFISSIQKEYDDTNK